MGRYVAVFGWGQKHQGHYLEFECDDIGKVYEYMQKEYDNKFSTTYELDYWIKECKELLKAGVKPETKMGETIVL